MWLRALHSSLCAILVLSTAAGREMRVAPNASAAPVNQLSVAGNACGPAALLNAFRFGGDNWRRASDAITGKNDRERVLTVIREIGMRPSKHMQGRARWSRRGVSVADMCDMANEMCAGKYLPFVVDEVFFLKPGETSAKLLKRVHQRLDKSLAKGLPPVLSIRRHALRGGQWVVIDAHFVTITGVSRKLEKNESSFPVQYIDPWGGKRCEGVIGIPQPAFFANSDGQSSCLEAVFPQSQVGAKQVRKGERSVLAVSAGIGCW